MSHVKAPRWGDRRSGRKERGIERDSGWLWKLCLLWAARIHVLLAMGFFWGWGVYKAGTQLAIGRFMWRRWKATIIGSWAHSRPNHHWPLLLTWLSALCPSPRETKLKVQAAFKHDYELGQHVVSSSICPIGDAMFNYARPGISQMRLAPKRPCCWVERDLPAKCNENETYRKT